MLTKRIIAVLLLSKGRVVKTRRFANPRDVGDPVKQAKILYDNGADEIVVLNIDPDTGIQPLLDWLPKMAERVFVPIAAGGGVRSVDDAAKLIAAGAEKVVIRTAVDIIPDVAKRFGSQAVSQCCDIGAGVPQTTPSEEAGEIIVQTKVLDGMMCGYDLVAPLAASSVTSAPVVLLGGCGNYQHMLDAFQAGADACAAGSLWAFTDSNPIRAKKWLRGHGIHTRAA